MRTSIHQAAPARSRRKARCASFAKLATLAIVAAPLAAMAWTSKPVKVLVPAPDEAAVEATKQKMLEQASR